MNIPDDASWDELTEAHRNLVATERRVKRDLKQLRAELVRRYPNARLTRTPQQIAYSMGITRTHVYELLHKRADKESP